MRAKWILPLTASMMVLCGGCQQKTVPIAVTLPVADDSSAIVIDIAQGMRIQHEAQTGQTLVWKAVGPGAPNFWIQFGGTSPCSSGAAVLAGSTKSPASCTASLPKGAKGTVFYSYLILASPPSPGPIPDRAVNCFGCNN